MMMVSRIISLEKLDARFHCGIVDDDIMNISLEKSKAYGNPRIT